LKLFVSFLNTPRAAKFLPAAAEKNQRPLAFALGLALPFPLPFPLPDPAVLPATDMAL
jgi:hypothetical protein